MIKTINSKELKTDADLVCTYCGKEHSKRNPDGTLRSIEGKDYVFEIDTIKKDEWCICVECQKEWDKKVL